MGTSYVLKKGTKIGNTSATTVWPDKQETKLERRNRDKGHSSSDQLFDDLGLRDNKMLKVTKTMGQVK